MKNLKSISENVYSDNPLSDWGADRDWYRMDNENGNAILKPCLYENEPCDEDSLSEWESNQTKRIIINPKGNKKLYKNNELVQKFERDQFVFYYTE
jgi:hypothetical protein